MLRYLKRPRSSVMRSRVKPQRSSASVRLSVECLESRCVPAGNVTATKIGNTLRIIGDTSDNTIFIAQSGSNVVVEGGSSTTVNGTSWATFSGIANLDIRMSDGNDSVTIGESSSSTITGLSLSGWLKLQGGDGDDTLSLRHVSVAKTTTIRGNDGDDSVSVSDGSSFQRNVSIALDTGSSLENINIDGSSGANFFNFPTVLSGSDVDTNVIVQDSSFASSLVIRTGAADDYVLLFDVSATITNVLLRDGNDTLEVEDSSFATITANTGNGNDNLNFGISASNSVSLSANFILGNGTNIFDSGAPGVSNSFGFLNISGGANIDIVQIHDISVSELTNISLGDGNDDLEIENSSFAKAVKALMGNGDDTVTLNNNTFEMSDLDLFDGGPHTASGGDIINGDGNIGLNLAAEVTGFETVDPNLP